MADNLKSTGGRDRQKVAGKQGWEIHYMKEKFNVSSQQITGAIKAVGHDRKKVEEYLKNKSSK